MDLSKLKERIKSYNPHANFEIIEKAFEFAKEKHEGQKRSSGSDYFEHLYETAFLLTRLKADSDSIAAALLHDVVEDTPVTFKELEGKFGKEIRGLVEGVTKLDKVSFANREDYNAENIRKVVLAMTKDIRVIFIKLADRLHNMRTLKFLDKEKQIHIAKETRNIYAPIAQKLGIYDFKGEMEDLSMRILEPEAYQRLRNIINQKRDEREKATKQLLEKVTTALKDRDVDAYVEGRAKYFYSIYKKMVQKGKDFSEIYDLIALRIITKTVADAYKALGAVHSLWKPIPKKFKDYIAVPKANGYQSLHTAVMGEHGKILEVQIRTEEMHSYAEEGIAAHWRYKGSERDKKFDQKVQWIKQIVHWMNHSRNAQDFIEQLKFDLFYDEICVFTPKGDPIMLPEGASVIDFAYAVHTNVGNTCYGAEVNNKIVPLNYILKSADIVNIITRKNAKPAPQWLNYVKTNKARSKIKQSLSLKQDNNPGRENKKRRLAEKSEEPGVTSSDLISKIDFEDKKKPLKFAKCCNPEYGDPIIGFYTKDKKVTVHKKDCDNISSLDDLKSIELEWKREEKSELEEIELVLEDRLGILKDVLAVMSDNHVSVFNINSHVDKNKLYVKISIKNPGEELLETVMKTLRDIKGVMNAELK